MYLYLHYPALPVFRGPSANGRMQGNYRVAKCGTTLEPDVAASAAQVTRASPTQTLSAAPAMSSPVPVFFIGVLILLAMGIVWFVTPKGPNQT